MNSVKELVAQWIEHPLCVRDVIGSIPVGDSDVSLSHARVMLINSPFTLNRNVLNSKHITSRDDMLLFLFSRTVSSISSIFHQPQNKHLPHGGRLCTCFLWSIVFVRRRQNLDRTGPDLITDRITDWITDGITDRITDQITDRITGKEKNKVLKKKIQKNQIVYEIIINKK